MSKKWIMGFSILWVCSILTGCHMKHDWQEATCTEPKTCTIGSETEGEALGHTWIDATCAEPKHCSVCGETEGEALAHTWIDATCAEPKHCSVCGETEGEPLEHTLAEANYQQPATCEVCGEIVGEPLQPDFEKLGLECNAELNTTYPYVTICGDAPEYTTTGNLMITDYEIFLSDESHEAKDGYEWRAVTLTFTYDDDNALKYGSSTFVWDADYYDVKSTIDTWEDNTNTYTVNYNGIDYPECTSNFEALQSGWDKDVFTKQYRYFVRIPENYDGAVVSAINSKQMEQYVDGETYINDLADDDTIFFRLK